jgi:hypothetical protein
MSLNFYANMFSRGQRKVRNWFFIIGVLLVGFGLLIWLLRDLFALLFAAFFASLGVASIVIAIRMFWSGSRMTKESSDPEQAYRENVRIHTGENHYQ